MTPLTTTKNSTGKYIIKHFEHDDDLMIPAIAVMKRMNFPWSAVDKATGPTK